MQIIIENTTIRQDAEGRYCLNDLHRAAGRGKKHGPSYWLANAQTKEMIAQLLTTGIPVVTLEGAAGGTYVCKELVYLYAMWISPSFSLKVIRAYDAQVSTTAIAISPTALELFSLALGSIKDVNAMTAVHGIRIGTLEQNLRLENWQQCNVKRAVDQKVHDLAKKHKLAKKLIYPKMWRRIKDTFQVPRYNEIPALQYEEALLFVESLTLKSLF